MTKHLESFDLLDVFYIVRTTVNGKHGSIEPVAALVICIC